VGSRASDEITTTTTPSSYSKKAILLRNLGPSDVVFGTKGNGRNEVFLQLLEEHAGLYVKSSKFEKMALIQRLIRDWKGNFYFLNPKTNELSLAREKSRENLDSDDEEASLPSTSSKLYTSVRRMMNYVVAKNNYSYQETAAASTASAKRSSSGGSSTKTSKKRKESFDDSAAPLKKSKKMKKTASKKAAPAIMAAPPSVTRSDTLSPVPLMMGSNKRISMLVTPEPSPRTQLLTPVSFQEGEAHPSYGNNCIHLPATFVSSPAPSRAGANTTLLRPASKVAALSSPPGPRKLSEKYIGRLEDTAIATLVSLSSASWSEEAGEEQEPVGLYF
jgi:hypothetical protein